MNCTLTFSAEIFFRSITIPFLLGIAGWFSANWLTKPWLAFLETRRHILEELIYYANVYPGFSRSEDASASDKTLNEEWDTLRPTIRRLGARLKADYTMLTGKWRKPVYKLLCFLDGIELEKIDSAGSELIGLSNYDTRDERHERREKIKNALNIKP